MAFMPCILHGVRTIRPPSLMWPGDGSSPGGGRGGGGRGGGDGRGRRNEVGAGERQTSSDGTTSATSRSTM